jgi:DNA-binding beta-propeller fold protein YncE
MKQLKALLTGLALVASVAAQAQTTAVIWQQAFGSGLGAFTPLGGVSTAADGARLVGSAWSSDGMITSNRFSTAGFANVTLSYDRACTTGLDTTEGLIAEYSLTSGSYVRLELTRDTTVARASFSLPAEAANASVALRFRINANAPTETCTVNNISLNGSSVAVSSTRPAIGKFTTFESGQVRPMALSANGQRLFAVNTPDNRVEIFDVRGTVPVSMGSVSVGLEPVALALAPDGKLWVVNHLSDSISIVDVSVTPARIVQTLLVGDEPRDIVFAGPSNQWAFITAAHRGQNVKFDPQLTTAGVGRADVWVFNAAAPGTALGGTPLTVLNMFGDTLRALARNADGSRVYAAVLNSGNKTTVLDEDMANGGLVDKAPPYTAADGNTQPDTGLIVQKNANGDWVDSGDAKSGTAPKKWNSRVKLDLPDYDVFTIDTTGSTPAVMAKTSGVGTTLFNMAVNPVSGKVYVSNQEALNLNRFEGPGTRSSTVRGHFVESRVTVIDGSTVRPRHLNKHISSYASALGTAAEKAAALATPLEMAVTPDGSQLYLVAMGSDKLARLGTAALEADTFTPSAASQLLLTGGGPTGLVLDAAQNRAFVMTRFDNGISVVNTTAFAEAAHVRMFNPEPAEVVRGRRFMYDARLTSSRGDSSCAGCHIFGDMDHLAWDLGNPDGVRVKSPNAYSANVPAILRRDVFHPMKGPMTTQSFRGMAGNGPMHWRGDRTGLDNRLPGETLEERAFRDFNVAFEGLLGRSAALTDAQMSSFAKFALNLSYPPNPVANLDNTLTATQQAGLTAYNTVKATGLGSCNSCHVLDIAKNRFGTAGLMSFEGTSVAEDFKIPHLRNMYQKVGMFTRNIGTATAVNAGAQIRGFGFDKSGVSGTIPEFLRAAVFTLTEKQRTDIEQMVLAMPSNLLPIVGQQVTVTPANATQADVVARMNLLVQRAAVTTPRPECELVAKAVIGSEQRGWVMNSAQSFVPDRASESPVTLSALLAQASNAASPLTLTCVPPGNGTRIGIDRNADAILDRN